MQGLTGESFQDRQLVGSTNQSVVIRLSRIGRCIAIAGRDAEVLVTLVTCQCVVVNSCSCNTSNSSNRFVWNEFLHSITRNNLYLFNVHGVNGVLNSIRIDIAAICTCNRIPCEGDGRS